MGQSGGHYVRSLKKHVDRQCSAEISEVAYLLELHSDASPIPAIISGTLKIKELLAEKKCCKEIFDQHLTKSLSVNIATEFTEFQH